jgi:serine/threonine-protein kinase
LDPERLVPPRHVNPDVSQATEGAILAAMGPHPGNRPPTVDAWFHLLRSGEPLPTPVAKPSLWGQVWRDSGWLLVLGLLFTALVLYLTFR